MRLNSLPKTTTRSKKRIGRGYGSGKGGHTVGRGTKGQKARSKVRLGFEGGQTSLIHRLPLRRGKGNKPAGKKPLTVNVKHLNLLPADTLVTVDALIAHRIVKKDEAKKFGVKVLGDGKLAVPLRVDLPVSKGAAQKIEKAGGEVVRKPKIKNKKLKVKREEKKRREKKEKGEKEKRERKEKS
ncbi:TPA: 50S ribosomal protein L15 [Candidatus Bathyarchaeota archaeon]|nr:50S ribosomal protein L15 [Candidatus Bathyarchaeota archaeon]